MTATNLLANLEQLDSSLSYLAKNPDGTDCMSFRGLGDGTWQLSHSGRETTMIMSEPAVKRQLHSWRASCGTVQIFACCCPKCSPPHARVLQNQIFCEARLTHGYWPDCLATWRAQLLREVQADAACCVGC